MMTREEIVVELRAITSGFQRQMKAASEGVKTFKRDVRLFSNTMAMPMEQFKAMSKNMKQALMPAESFAQRIRLATHGLRGFRMEMLGVMFFGLMMKNFFLGLLKPVSDAFGVMDLFQQMLLVLFIPIMESLFPIILWLTEAFMNLTPTTQWIIGLFVVLFSILGTSLFLVGSFALGLGSLIQAFGFLGPVFAKVIVGIKAVTTTLFGAVSGWFALIGGVLAVIAVFLLLHDKFGKDWWKAWVSGIILAIALLIQGVVDLLLAPINLIIDAIKKAIELYNKAANSELGQALGMKAIDISGIKDLGMKIDVVGNVATLLDKYGMNPEEIKKTTETGSASNSLSGSPYGTTEMQVESLKGAGFDNAQIVNMLAGQKNGGVQQTIAPTYNINVQDTAELQKMLAQQVEEMRRISTG